MELAASGLFRAKWTDRIHDEWISNVLKHRADLTSAQLTRTRDLMNRAVPDCLVKNYEDLIDGLNLPDPDDRHVLAAAIAAASDAIVTFNLKDFPKDYLWSFNMEALHPDAFIHQQFGLDKASVLVAARRCRERLRTPARSADAYLDTLEKQGLPQTVSELRQYSAIL